DVRAAEDAKSFGISGHYTILDAVVHHLDEMPRAICPAMEIALLGCAADLFAARRPRDFAHAGRQRRENWIEPADGIAGPADHHAVAAFQPPHPTARSDIDVVNLLSSELLSTADIVDIVRVAAIDQNIAGF